jgi:enediyne biosynthesis protein E3
MKRVVERLLKIRPEEASFNARGFEASDPTISRRLEQMLESFIGGYNLAVETPDKVELSRRLYAAFDSHHVGFAFEGVGFYLGMLDLLIPGKPYRLDRYLKGAGEHHDYIVAVGAGFAVARIPWGLRTMDDYLQTLDPLIAWCVACGYGFHEGFFHHRRFIDNAASPPASLSSLGRQLIDSGLGRSLWWVKGADPSRIHTAIDRFPEARRAELWAGIGIAACYAGGVGVTELLSIQELSGPYRADLLSGCPFAARLRQKAGNYSDTTELACRTLLNRSTDEVADMAEAAADAVRSQVRGSGITEVYALLRRHLVTQCQTIAKVPSYA